MIYDCHIHLNGWKDLPNLKAVMAAVTPADWPLILDFSGQYSGKIFPALGIHPSASEIAEAESKKADLCLAKLIDLSPRLSAIGEIGLDFSQGRSPEELARQVWWLLEQIKIAKKYDLPVILHFRQAWDIWQQILLENKSIIPLKGVVHNFTGSSDVAEMCLKAGLSLSFSSPVLNDNAENLRQVAGKIPLERVLVDSDSPYSAVSSEQLGQVIEKIAKSRNVPVEDMMGTIEENFQRLFACNHEKSS